MTDAMVTARMSATKKDVGNRVLERLGTNASQAVNELYDYIVENGVLPWQANSGQNPVNKKRLSDALSWVDSITASVPSKISSMTIKDAKRARLGIGNLK